MQRTRNSYRMMVNRCTNPAAINHKDYGGRGIFVCQRWLESYDNFLEDMGERPAGTTIERIDNDGPYSPENCRWATMKEQCANRRMRRDAVLLTLNGKTQTLSAWAKEIGVNRQTLSMRLRKRGYSAHEALTMPKLPHGGAARKYGLDRRAKNSIANTR